MLALNNASAAFASRAFTAAKSLSRVDSTAVPRADGFTALAGALVVGAANEGAGAAGQGAVLDAAQPTKNAAPRMRRFCMGAQRSVVAAFETRPVDGSNRPRAICARGRFDPGPSRRSFGHGMRSTVHLSDQTAHLPAVAQVSLASLNAPR